MSEIKKIYLQDYKEPAFTVESCDLVFELFEEYTRVTNLMKVQKKDKECGDLVLDALELELEEIYIDEERLEDGGYEVLEEKLIVKSVPEEFKLIVINKIYPHQNSELEGLYKSGNIFCTQNEPEGFRRITPYIDRPDVMATFRTTIVADRNKYPVLLGNGNRESNFRLDDGRHGVTWIDPHPKPSYLFALVAGDLGVIEDKFITKSKKYVRLFIYTDKGNEPKCSYAMESLKQAMKWDEEVYGREYDLDIYNIVAVDSFNMGAMENKGLNIFNSAYVLASQETATDANFMGIQSVIAHEYFHNWTGNRITCKDWFELTLKEGLTVFRDQCFSADMNSREIQRIKDVQMLAERQFVEDASPTAHPIKPDSYIAINNFYTPTVYEKGAEVIRMLHTLLGEEKYRKAMDIYFDTFDGQAVRTDDFLWAMSKGGGIDLEHFKLWYRQSGTPRVLIAESFKDGEYTLTLTQKIPPTPEGKEQKPYFFPFKIGLLDRSGKELLQKTLIVSKEKEEFTFKIGGKPVLSPNRDFSAPVIVESEDEEHSFLLKYDTNGYTRYEAAVAYATETLRKMMRGESADREFIEAYGYICESESDPSYKALLLELPSVSVVMQQERTIDFDIICDAKETLQRELASLYKEKLLYIYEHNHEPTCKETDALSMGKRALKNRALKILASLGDEHIAQIAYKQYVESVTMTDTLAALGVLEEISPSLGSEALGDFYKKYKNDTLVMQKYFSVIASSSREGVLERVTALQRDEAYNELVPNLLRSLVGVFSRNYKYFHAKDGSGYRFITDKIIDIDKINPQMSSALGGAFKIYKKLNDQNKKMMKKELERVVSTRSISKNLYEIVGKIINN